MHLWNQFYRFKTSKPAKPMNRHGKKITTDTVFCQGFKNNFMFEIKYV